MRGSVVKKNERWYVVIEDKDPATGKRKRRWHSGYRTKREAQSACNELAAAMQRGDYLQTNRQTVGEFVREWLTTIAPTVRPSTLDKYERDLRTHVVGHIGFIALAKLDGPALNRLWAEHAVSGKKTARPGGRPDYEEDGSAMVGALKKIVECRPSDNDEVCLLERRVSAECASRTSS